MVNYMELVQGDSLDCERAGVVIYCSMEGNFGLGQSCKEAMLIIHQHKMEVW